MSALEQIRKRPALVISVLGIALLLFIITLAWDNKGGNPFSNPQRMAKVDGVEINYSDFSDAVSDAGNDQDASVVRDQVMQQLIHMALLDKAIADANVTVTPAEINKMLFDPEVNPQAEMFQQQYNMIYAPEKLGLSPEQTQSLRENQEQMRQGWEQGIEQMTKQRMQQKYFFLLTGALTANKLDVADYAQQRNNISDVQVAMLSASTLKDDDFEVSDADIKAMYDKERNLWALNQEVRPLTIIRQYVEASDADIKAADALIAATVKSLATTPGLEAIADNMAFTTNSVSAPKDRLPNNVKSQLDEILSDTVVMLNGLQRNHRNIAKLLGTQTMTDSVKVDFVLFDKQSVKADSVLNLLNSGADLTGSTTVFRNDSIPMALADPQYATVRDIINNAADGEYIVAEDNSPLQQLLGNMQGAGIIYRVVERQNPVTVYDIAVIDYRLEPSAKTVEEMTTKLREYANANNKADAFRDNAHDANMPVYAGRVTSTSFAISSHYGPMPDSSAAARWAMEAEKGQVSDILTGSERRGQGDPAQYIMVVAVNDIYDGDYIPATADEVKEHYKPQVLNKLKAEKLLEKYNGKAKDVEGYAKAMGVNVLEQSISMGRYGNKLSGKVAAAKKGALVGPFATDDGIAVFTVTNVNEAPAADYDAVKESVRQQMFGMLQRMFPAILMSNKHIDGDVAKFISNQ